jgi:peptidoglycan hydrolase CwlO-like protein
MFLTKSFYHKFKFVLVICLNCQILMITMTFVDVDKAAELRSVIARLESELSELQQSRTAMQLENQQHLEAIDKLQRENQDLQLKV